MSPKRPSSVEDETLRMLDALRRCIRRSPFSQRQIESRAGFSKGYLSRLLSRKLDLKFAHITAILAALRIESRAFFGGLYPPRGFAALEGLRDESECPPPLPDVAALHRVRELYERRLGSLDELKRKVERCEEAILRLEHLGLIKKRLARESPEEA